MPSPLPPTSSPPVQFVFGTPMCEATSFGFHKVIARAADAAAPGCVAAFRAAFDAMQQLGATPEGRVELATRMGLCAPKSAIRSSWSAFNLYGWLYDDLLVGRVQVGGGVGVEKQVHDAVAGALRIGLQGLPVAVKQGKETWGVREGEGRGFATWLREERESQRIKDERAEGRVGKGRGSRLGGLLQG